ncbi:copper chaperone PCu(A)C [Novosphingobium sp. B 225]|uniref:copper chaperone PCu(A)C n=1 Tax=Novosphingobium sp. B 225 TaxID=1961849 RepID=UPI000B4B304E|nr:copper chaperone PCu(A)C [Novosphingobium sp. B 225]
MRRSLLILAPLTLGLGLSACQQQANAPEAAASTGPEAKPGVAVSGGTLVLPAVKGNPGVAYFDVANSDAKAVALAAVAVDGAAKAEMHQTSGGSMAPVDRVEIDPNTSVKFAPGALHVMLFDLDPKLATGGSAEMTLTFADGDKISAPLSIKSAGEAAMGGMEH